jgi:hypothetical protein
MKAPTIRTEALFPLVITHDELIAIGDAITRYTTWLAHTSASAVGHQETIALLDHLQERFMLLVHSEAQEG